MLSGPPSMSKRQDREPDDNGEDLFNQVLSGSGDLVGGGGALGDIYSVKNTYHAADAIDFEDEDELAEDEEAAIVAPSGGATRGSGGEPTGFSEDEGALQDAAEHDFDDMFGGADNAGIGLEAGGDLFDGIGQHHDDDGLDLGMFEDTAPQKRAPVDEREAAERRAKKRQRLEAAISVMERKLRQRNLRRYFPQYSPAKPFNNHALFLPAPRYYGWLRPPIALRAHVKPLVPTKVVLEAMPDQRRAFRSRSGAAAAPLAKHTVASQILHITEADFATLDELQRRDAHGSAQFGPVAFLQQNGSRDVFGDLPKDVVFSATTWDDDAIINGAKHPVTSRSAPLPEDSDSDHDMEIFNGDLSRYTNLKLDMNDPNLIFVPAALTKERQSRALVPLTESLLASKFNILNDQQYEVLKRSYNTKVRSHLSNLAIDHSVPAMRLQSPYYKVRLTKRECRAFHRPRFVVRPGTTMNFSRLKVRKKKRDRGKTPQEIFAKTGDLTVADTATMVAMEFAEEYPPVVQNFGMGSKIINYYRKETKDDLARPKAPLGETHVLGMEDRSPFWNFGHVAGGDFVPTLYNNLVRAPVFKQEPRQTDFLLIRSQGSGSHTRHYLRKMANVFTVGQLFPAVEVPAPHSRKITNTSKNRLKIIVYRTMHRQGEERILVRDILHHFPDQNDMQNRQRLKEFMEYQRQGDDQGFWKMKNHEPIPNEDEIRTMITPEDLCLLDSMQMSQQMMADYSFVFKSMAKDEKKEENEVETDTEKNEGKESSPMPKPGPAPTEKESKKKRERDDKERDMEELQEELTTWNTSRNFINANQTKANLQLNGIGDPTGIGLGFLFLRATQKNPFTPLHIKEDVNKDGKPNTSAQTQKIYEDEVSRIWYAQRRSLTVEPGNPTHNLDAIYKEYKPVATPKIDTKELTENKLSILRITRRFRDENNIVQRRVHAIKDPILMRAYLKRKKQIEDDLLRNAEVDDIVPTNDKELNRLRRKALEEKLANLEKRAKLGKGRKISHDALHAAAAAGGIIIDANTVMLPDGSYAIGGKGIGKGKSRTRRCTACGALGHIRTNKTCPLFEQTKLQLQGAAGETGAPSEALDTALSSQPAATTVSTSPPLQQK